MSKVSEEVSRDLGIEAVWEEMRPRFRRIVGRSGIPAIDAEDLIQETLVIALRQWEQIRDKQAWLAQVLHYRCVCYWRRQREQRVEAMDPSALEGVADLRPAPQERELMYVDLERLLGRLRRRHAALIRLRYGVGFSTSETAERLGYTHDGIRKMTLIIVERLRRELSGRSPRSTSGGLGGRRRRPTGDERAKIAENVLSERMTVAAVTRQYGIIRETVEKVLAELRERAKSNGLIGDPPTLCSSPHDSPAAISMAVRATRSNLSRVG